MKALLALRVSTEGKGQDEGDQEAPLRAVAERMGWPVVGVVRTQQSAWKEASASAWEKQVRLELVNTGADVLMVWSLDRFTRQKPVKAMQAVLGLEEHLGVHFWSLNEPFLNTTAGTFREPLLALIAWLGEQESAKKSERVTKKHAAKAAQADNLGQRAAWGRGRIPSRMDRLMVWSCKDAKMALRKIEAATGVPKSTVARILRDERLVPNMAEKRALLAFENDLSVPKGPKGHAGAASGVASLGPISPSSHDEVDSARREQ